MAATDRRRSFGAAGVYSTMALPHGLIGITVTGTAEKLSIRSVGIRDLNGTYHLVPFSSVDTVSNYMREFGAKREVELLCRGRPSADGRDWLVTHARYGSPTAHRNATIVELRWDDEGLPYCAPPG